MLNQFKKISQRLLKAKRVAAYRALNRAAAMTKTQMTKDIRASTGLAAKVITKRVYVRKASLASPFSFVSFGVQYGVPLAEFAPKEKIVRVGKGKTARKYRGVTVKLPEGRTLVPKAFLWKAPSGKAIVLMRKGEERRPLSQATLSLQQVAESHQRSLVSFMRQEFEKRFATQLEYELGKL